jgi:uncharacterized protein
MPLRVGAFIPLLTHERLQMKYVVIARYVNDVATVEKLRPAHRLYARQLATEGKLVAAGPFADGSGGLFIYEVGSLQEVEDLVAADPYVIGGAFASYETRPWEMLGANASAFTT